MTLIIKDSDLFVPSDRTQIDRPFFNKRFGAIMGEFRDIDSRMSVYDAQVADLVSVGLQRVNDSLGPMLAKVQQASDLGFLQCKSIGTSISLIVGNAEGFRVTEGQDLFTPTPFLMVMDILDWTNWGVVSVDAGGWTPSTGDLATHCVYATKTQASSQWYISCSAALLPAMQNLLTQSQSAASTCNSDLAAVNNAMVTINAALSAIQAGPVLSVAGKTGTVTLTEADIANLSTDLSARPLATSVNTQIASKQNQSAKLDAIAAMGWVAGSVLLASSPTSIGSLAVSTFMQGLFGAIDSATARSTLGVTQANLGISAFMQTMMNDADAATALTTLGVSAFIQTLLNDADAATARSTIGADAAYSPRSLDISVQATDFTLDATFNGKTIFWTKATAGTVTLSNAAPAGTECMIEQEGAGQITFAAAAGGTVQSNGGRLKSVSQYAMVTAFVYTNSTGTNAAWRMGGNLST